MTVDSNSNAHGAFESHPATPSFLRPHFEAAPLRALEEPHSAPGRRHRSADDEPPAVTGGLESAESSSPNSQKARRRRGSRGGRRRRTRQDGPADSDTVALAAASDEPADDDGDVPAEIPSEIEAGEPAPDVKRKRRRSRRGAGRATPSPVAASADSESEEGVEPPIPDDDETLDDFPSSRGGVPRELDAHIDVEDGEAGSEATEAAETSEFTASGRKKRRRRGSRGGRRRRATPAETASESAALETHAADIESIPGEEDDLPALKRAVEVAPSSEPAHSRRRGRGKNKKSGGLETAPAAAIEDDEPRALPESQRTALLLVNSTDPEEQRVAVLEDDVIADFQMTVKGQDSLVNDIYRGRVVNLEPAIGAAFIDFGQGRNGFLHTSDVISSYGEEGFTLERLLTTKIDPDEWDGASGQSGGSSDVADDEKERGETDKKKQKPGEGGKRRFRARPRLPITDLLRKGQMVVVQVTKDAIGDKGPALTTYISIPGRYLVLMPSMARTGVSRKIEDEKERKRLKRILLALDVPAGMGVIVRTAGVGHTKAEIKRDLDYLKGAWEAFSKRLAHGQGPAPLYRESDVAIRTLRDLFTPLTKAVIVDDPEVHSHLVDFATQLMPEDVGRIQLHDGQKPLFASYGIEQDFEKIFSRRIELPSGGSIVFDQAEALVAIDVNSGRTRSEGFDFEAIALKTNLEAVPEIARQIRLRDLGGIIVVDFIDMMKLGNIRAVERAFKDALDGDRARSKIGRISQFGLLELTRQRLGPGMSKKVFHTCTRCRGTGRIRTVNSRAAAILRRLGSALTLKGFSAVEVRAHPEVVAYLKNDCSEYIRALEYRFQREVKLLDANDQVEDSILRYLRTDGREVRPGGRKKR